MNDTPEFYAMVLSAGFGTRLAPLTDEVPKPLVPIGDTPLLGTSLSELRAGGARGLVVNVHHHAERIQSYLNGLQFDVYVSKEERILGTAGGIAAAHSLLNRAPLMIVNGDIVGKLPISALLEALEAGLVLAVTSRAVGEGTVGLGQDGRVVRLRGENFGVEVASGDYMGVALLGDECLSSLPSEGCLIGDWALPHLRAGGHISTVMVAQSFQDIGTPAEYLSANLRWLDSRPDRLGNSYLGEGVLLDGGVEPLGSVVGSGARVLGSGPVERSVILPGATARAPLKSVIVTPGGVVIPVGEGSEAPS